MPGIDFQEVRSQIDIQQVLDLIGFVPTARVGHRLRGPCPIHGSYFPRSRVFSVSLLHNRYRCFKCHSAGTQLDLWAELHDLTIYAAAEDLCHRLSLQVPRHPNPPWTTK